MKLSRKGPEIRQCFDFPLQFEAIPESLKNMLLVMSTAGIFDEEECTLTAHSQSSDERKTHKRSDSEIHKYSALWQVTWERIDCFLPNLRQELFTPRNQSPTSNTAQVKVETEVTTEEPKPAPPDLPGPLVEGKIFRFKCNVRNHLNRIHEIFYVLNKMLLLSEFSVG